MYTDHQKTLGLDVCEKKQYLIDNLMKEFWDFISFICQKIQP